MGRRGHAASKRDTQPVPARIAAVAVVVAVVVCPARVVRLFSVRVLRGLLAACRVGQQRAGAAGVAEPDYRCAGSRVECFGFRTSVRAVARERRRIRALDSVIATLDNTRQRNALVSPLKRLRSTSQRAAPLPASATAGAAGASGLLGAIASGLASIEVSARRGGSPLHYWAGRLRAAGNELYQTAGGAPVA